MKKINEEFLHFLWKNQQLTGITFYTAGNFDLHVIDPGSHNLDSGPDFFNAKVEIDHTIWAGNIELHINASDWLKHGHSTDNAYDSVILHVVYYNDCEITRTDGSLIPTAILKFPTLLWDTYARMKESSQWIPCQDYLSSIKTIHFAQWTSSLMIQKLEEKTDILSKSLKELHSHWDAIFCRLLFRAFGTPVNTTPFEMLALLLPYPYLLRNKKDPFTLESILFGKAGMLNSTIPKDRYSEALQNEYKRHAIKLNTPDVPGHIWKFMRMRPSSFPSLRIAQLAYFIHLLIPFHEKLESKPSLSELKKNLRIKAGDYWNTHYLFGKESTARFKYLGDSFIRSLIINCITPYAFFYGKIFKNQDFCEYAIGLLEDLPAENNVILKNWGKFGIKCTSSFESQAMLFLYKKYCKQKRCLECQFGNSMIIDATFQK